MLRAATHRRLHLPVLAARAQVHQGHVLFAGAEAGAVWGAGALCQPTEEGTREIFQVLI